MMKFQQLSWITAVLFLVGFVLGVLGFWITGDGLRATLQIVSILSFGGAVLTSCSLAGYCQQMLDENETV